MRVLCLLSCLGGVAAAQDSSSTSPSDAALLKEIEAASAPPPVAKSASGFFSNTFNPAMSLNGLLLGSISSEDDASLEVQELELQFQANVDAYLSANVILAMPGGSGIEVEEGIVSVTAKPLGLNLRGGKMKLPFGRENVLHTHALPFVDKSLAGTSVFGDEGLNEVGGELSYLVPVPWYWLLSAAVVAGDNEVLFASPDGRDLAGFAGMKHVFDLTDDATLELGASYAIGDNAARNVSQAIGAHAVFKWRPAANASSSSAVVVVEGFFSRNPTPDTPRGQETDQIGGYVYGQWQLAQRWYLGARAEALRKQSAAPVIDLKQSAIAVFVPTEFSAVRLQGSVTEPGAGGNVIVEGFVQLNFTLGAHPAHAY